MDFDPIAEIDRAMDAMARPCVLMHRVLIEADTRTRSRLGGLPNLPDVYAWPEGRMEYEGAPQTIALPFLAQIDFAEVPDPTGLLPRSGMLFVFADIDGHVLWDQAQPREYSRLLYVPEVASGTPERQPPLSLVPVDDCGHPKFVDPCLSVDSIDRRHYHAWSVRFGVAESYPVSDILDEQPAWQALRARFAARASADPVFAAEWGGDAADDVYHDRRGDRRDAQRARLFGDDAPREIPAEIGSLPDPDQLPPLVQGYAWEIVEAALADLRRERETTARRLDAARHKIRKPGLFGWMLSPRTSPFIDALAAHTVVLDKAIRAAEAEHWQLREIPPDAVLDAARTEGFKAWMKAWIAGHAAGLGQSREYGLPDPARTHRIAVEHFARRCGGDPRLRRHLPGGAATIAALYPEQPVHQMLGWFDTSQDNSALTDGSVPLLHLSYDTAPGFRICDVGEFQVFLDPKDLARRDFARARAQMQGG